MRIGIGMLAVAAITATMMAWGGMALAGDKSPEQGTWEYQAALETGSLPAGYFVGQQPAKDTGVKAALAEHGGIVYRIGIDTP